MHIVATDPSAVTVEAAPSSARRRRASAEWRSTFAPPTTPAPVFPPNCPASARALAATTLPGLEVTAARLAGLWGLVRSDEPVSVDQLVRRCSVLFDGRARGVGLVVGVVDEDPRAIEFGTVLVWRPDSTRVVGVLHAGGFIDALDLAISGWLVGDSLATPLEHDRRARPLAGSAAAARVVAGGAP